jgi:hypothetical protein
LTELTVKTERAAEWLLSLMVVMLKFKIKEKQVRPPLQRLGAADAACAKKNIFYCLWFME